jgi:tetratricopeptide (TPR) repeat protein
LVADGDTDKAIELARGVVKRVPGATYPRAVLVGALLAGRDCAAADREAALLAADEPRVAQWMSAQGAAKLCAGDTIKALEFFRKALALDPNNTAALFQQSAMLYAQRRNTDADALFVRAAEVAPAKSSMLMPPSNALDKETELVEVEAALVANPYDIGRQHQRAWLLVQLRRDDEALAQARAILSVKPDHVGARAVEGALRALNGDAEQALDILGKVLDAEPDQLEARLYSALSRMYLGRYSEASRDLLAYRSILQSRPGATVFSTASDISGVDTLRSYANLLDGAFAVDEKRVVSELDAVSKQLGAMTFSAAFGPLSDRLGSGRVMTLTILLSLPASLSASARLTTTSALQLVAAGIGALEIARVTPNLAGGVLVFRDASGDIGHLRVTRAAAIQLTLGMVPSNPAKPSVAWFRPVDPARPPFQFAAGAFRYFDPLLKSLKTAEASPDRMAEIWRERGAPIGADLEQRARADLVF